LGRPGHRARPDRWARSGHQAHLGHPGLNDTSFKQFNLNFFYKKWILDFELYPNIWIEFKS